MEDVECYNCGGEGYSHHDCGECTCVCLEPENNIICEICYGKGGWPVIEDNGQEP